MRRVLMDERIQVYPSPLTIPLSARGIGPVRQHHRSPPLSVSDIPSQAPIGRYHLYVHRSESCRDRLSVRTKRPLPCRLVAHQGRDPSG